MYVYLMDSCVDIKNITILNISKNAGLINESTSRVFLTFCKVTGIEKRMELKYTKMVSMVLFACRPVG